MVNTRFGERYTYVPQALFSLTFLAIAATWTRPASTNRTQLVGERLM